MILIETIDAIMAFSKNIDIKTNLIKTIDNMIILSKTNDFKKNKNKNIDILINKILINNSVYYKTTIKIVKSIKN